MSGFIIYHNNILDNERINELGPLSLPILETSSIYAVITGRKYAYHK